MKTPVGEDVNISTAPGGLPHVKDQDLGVTNVPAEYI